MGAERFLNLISTSKSYKSFSLLHLAARCVAISGFFK
jgi:hypothetical protein